jgi:uncharacterized protein
MRTACNLLGRSEISEVDIVEMESIELKQPLVILGFVGAGLAAQIAVNQIINELKMKEIAHVRSKYIPPSVVFMDGKLKPPFRIYSGDQGKLCVVVCDTPLPSEGLYNIGATLVDWAEGKGAKELVVLEGIPVRGIPKKRESLCVTEPEKRRECEAKGARMLSGHVLIHGIAGSVLSECLTRKVTGLAFLTPAASFMPDPEGAATLLNTLDDVYGLRIDTGMLLKSAKQIQRKLGEVARSYQEMRRAEAKKGTPEAIYT